MAINQFGENTADYTYNIKRPQKNQSHDRYENGIRYRSGGDIKINQTLRAIQAGARNNKYRIFYESLGEDFDIMVNATNMPGRDIGSAEVFVRGRKYKLAGEMSDDGTWEATFYNDPELFHRRFFLKMLDEIHNFTTPDYLLAGGDIPASDLNGGSFGLDNASGSSVSVGDFIKKLNNTVDKVNQAFYKVKAIKNKATNNLQVIKRAVNGDWGAMASLFSVNNYQRPWYMQEIHIQQLDHDGRTVFTTTLHNAYVSGISPLEYQDEAGDISTTTVTFEYSGVTFS